MIVRFRHEFDLPLAKVYSYFQTPGDWNRFFGLASPARDLGDGWFAVPLKRFPFPLVARNIEQRPQELVRWVFRGFWRGRGEARFIKTGRGCVIEGYEEVAIRWMFFLSPVAERLFLRRRFRAVWDVGWHRLRKQEAAGRTAAS